MDPAAPEPIPAPATDTDAETNADTDAEVGGEGAGAGTETRSGTMPAGGVTSNARHRSKRRRRGLVMIGLSTGLFVDGLRFTGLHVVEGISKIISLPFCICPSMLKFMVFL
jgi:hypothetical protein